MILELILAFCSFLLLSFCTSFFFTKCRSKAGQLPPGPMALPIIGHLHLLGPLLHQSFSGLSSRYGPLIHVRLGSNLCVVGSTPEVAEELLKTHDLTFSARDCSQLAINYLTYNNSSFVFAPYGPYWKYVRKLSTVELLGHRMLSQLLPARTRELRHFVRALYSKANIGQRVSVGEELRELLNNIITHMILGNVRSSGISESQVKVATTVARQVTQIFGELNISDCIWFCKNLDLQGFRKRIDDIHVNYDALLEDVLTNRERLRALKAKGSGSEGGGGEQQQEAKNFLDIILNAMDDETADVKLTRNHVKALLLDFFTAATDTLAAATEWTMAELINNPRVLEKAREEIQRVVGNNRLVEESDSPKLPYLQAIMKETFRLHPPVPMVSRKSVQECEINGYTIPAGTALFVNTWSICRDSRYWENPLEFRPERFLEGNGPAIDIKGLHYQLLPFGSGRRTCPGINLVMLEVPITVAALIQCFDWKVVNPRPPPPGASPDAYNEVVDMTERGGLTVSRAHELVCVPVARIDNTIVSDLEH